MGLFYARDAGRHDDVLRGCLVAQFFKFLREPAFDRRLRGGPRSHEHDHQSRRACRDAGVGRRVRPFLSRVRRFARAVFILVVHVRRRARRHGVRDGAALRARVRMVYLADPGALVSVRRRFVPALHAARLDARAWARVAAVLRVRGHARRSSGRGAAGSAFNMGRRARHDFPRGRVLDFRAHVPARRSQRAYRSL